MTNPKNIKIKGKISSKDKYDQYLKGNSHKNKINKKNEKLINIKRKKSSPKLIKNIRDINQIEQEIGNLKMPTQNPILNNPKTNFLIYIRSKIIRRPRLILSIN